MRRGTVAIVIMLTAGVRGMLTAGVRGMLTAGVRGMLTAGVRGMLTAGVRGMLTAGLRGMLLAAAPAAADSVTAGYGVAPGGNATPGVGGGTLHVVSAGNSGSGTNTVGAPGSGYNTLTVAALGSANTFNSVASFSSRAPQDYGYVGTGGGTIPGVRAAVDLAAPGVSITSAFYGGQNGGNNVTLAGSTDQGSSPTAYSSSINGTSFAAPLVAGGAALVSSAAATLAPLTSNTAASHAMVVKSLLLTGADKTSGWNNGKHCRR